jgi:hypothetical protein
MIKVPGYANAVVLKGTAFGQPESGIRQTHGMAGLTPFELFVDANNNNRFPPRDGTDGASALTANEVRTIIAEGIKVAHRTRAQVRKPLGSPAGETVVISDTNGVVLGIGRTRDSLVDAIDVTTQKARTAAFFSGAFAARDVQSVGQRTLRRKFRQWHGRADHASTSNPPDHVSAFAVSSAAPLHPAMARLPTPTGRSACSANRLSERRTRRPNGPPRRSQTEPVQPVSNST